MAGVKLTATEAQRLVSFLDQWCRPATEQAQKEHLYWRARLEGPRS